MTPSPRKVPPLVAGLTLGAALGAASVAGVHRYASLRAEREQVAPAPATKAPPPEEPMPPRYDYPVFVAPGEVRHGSRLAFTWDGPEPLLAFRDAEGLADVVAGAAGDEERVRRLMRWTRAQFPVGSPEPYPPPDAVSTLREIRAGRTGGFCAQYGFVFVQAAQSLGIPARMVTLSRHEVCEAWLADQGRWTMLDPLFELQVVDGDGRSLSALEVRDARRGARPATLTAGARWTKDVASYLAYYDAVGIWIRNAFVTQPVNYAEFNRYRVWFEETPGQQSLPAASLRTSFREDLYGPPVFP